MLDRIRQLFSGKTQPKQAVDPARLIPDPNRVVAGFCFCLSGLNEPTGEYDAAQSIQTEFLDGLRERGLDENDAGIPLDSPFLPEIVTQLKRWKRARYFRAGCKFEFMLRADVQPEWEWFQLVGWHDVGIDWQKWECKADQIPSHAHWDHVGFMSEKLKKAIEADHLTGLDFVWVCDIGRYKAPQWYYALAKNPLGRGLDHPFFDPVSGANVWGDGELLRPEIRTGVRNFRKKHFRPGVGFGNPHLDALLEIFPEDEVDVRSFPQVLRRVLPHTDFGYVWDAALPSNLCCNRRARALLLKGGFLSEKDFEPIWVWDEPPSGTEILDDPQKPCRMAYPLSHEKWSRVLERVAKMEAEAKATPKPVLQLSVEEVFSRLLSRRDELCGVNPTAPPPTDATLDATRKKLPGLPDLWAAVLQAADAIRFNVEGGAGRSEESYEAAPLAELSEFHTGYQGIVEQEIPDAPPNLLHFASELCGDWLAFDLDTITPEGDCRIIKFDHETSSISREWPSILQLLDEALTIAQSEDAEEE